MEKDIVPELLEKIQNEFKNKTEKSKIIKAKIAELKSKKVSHKDSNEFAIEVGNILKEVFKDNIKTGILPDNKMYYNIAKRILEPNLKNNYDLVVGYAGDVQDILNKKAGINIAKQIPKINQEKIDNLIDKISEYDNFEDAKWLIDEPIVNFTQSVVDDVIKDNVEFQYQSGLQPKIIRREAGNCCEWCANLAGVYDYPHDVPKDVYKRHRYCRCTVEYIPGDGKRQNVWTKKVFSDDSNKDLSKFRIEQVNNVINNKLIKDAKEIEKTQRILNDKLVGKEVNGVKITNVLWHAADRGVSRGLKVSDIIDTIENPLKITEIKYDAQKRPSFNIIGERSTLSINPENGNVITTHKTHKKLIEKLRGGKNENNS